MHFLRAGVDKRLNAHETPHPAATGQVDVVGGFKVIAAVILAQLCAETDRRYAVASVIFAPLLINVVELLGTDGVRIDRNMTLGEMGHGRSPIGWLAAAVLGTLLRRSIKKGKPDLNILFQYNMPLRALAKMTNGAISMGMVDGIVMELQGFWIIGLVRVIVEAVKNLVLNSRMEERLKNS